MAGPPQRFAFVQLEFAFPLGPADGRYVTREEAGGDPARVVVLRTVGTQRRSRMAARRRGRRSEGGAEPAPVPTARATVIRVSPSLGSAEDADGWLEGRSTEELRADAADAVRELNALLRAHRAAALDPWARDVAPAGATVVRVGWGTGEQVADGRYDAAREVPPPVPGSRSRKRAEALRPSERLAAVLSRREELMACEELVLRARADVEAGRPREAALQARIALEALLSELDGLDGERLAELRADRESVGAAANEALRGEPVAESRAGVEEAVGRMEAALRSRRLRG